MARRALAGRDQKIIQGQRRDQFFARMRRKGGVPRLPSDGAVAEAVLEEPEEQEPGVTPEITPENPAEETMEREAGEAPR